ncbi:MAG TPA: hypothetical protein VKT32_07765 [Chthonomonadaceae bacterium]|nr:hypothetical protein [Chthonomonadaceae bacterium]
MTEEPPEAAFHVLARRQNAPLFTHVVHINPAGILAAYGSTGRGTAEVVRAHIESGRLIDLRAWMEMLQKDIV